LISAGAPPQTPLGELTAPPDPLAVFGAYVLLREGERRGGEGRRGDRRGGERREESIPIVPVLRNDHCGNVLAGKHQQCHQVSATFQCVLTTGNICFIYDARTHTGHFVCQ